MRSNIEPVVRFKDYPILFLRYLLTWKIIRQCTSYSQHELRTYVKEFLLSNPFTDGFHPFTNPDHFKSAVLYALCRRRNPNVVIETGVASGTSSVGILLALERNEAGHLYSIDLPKKVYTTDWGQSYTDEFPGGVTGWRVKEHLRHRWSLIKGSSQDLLADLLNHVGYVDIFYHDGEHTASNMSFEMEHSWSKLTAGGLLVVDNINWNQSFFDFCWKKSISPTIIYPYVGIAMKPNKSKNSDVRIQ